MQDHRTARWVAPVMIGLAWLSSYVNHPATYGGRTLAMQAGVVLAIVLPVSLAMWRHYRVNLKPSRERLKAFLRQLT